MTTERGHRLLRALPAIYATSDRSGDLVRLLGALEELLFDADESTGLPGIEQRLSDIPKLLMPEAMPDRFVDWLAAWLGFTPHALFDHRALRGIVEGLVELHGLRGTRGHLAALLQRCFDEIATFAIDDRPKAGLHVGHARLGTTSRLACAVPFRFEVAATVHRGQKRTAALEQRIRAVIDFAKPAHTRYELQWTSPASSAPADRPHSASPLF